MQYYWISVACNSTNSVMTMLRRGTVSLYGGMGHEQGRQMGTECWRVAGVCWCVVTEGSCLRE
jgi:hypothetical protein